MGIFRLPKCPIFLFVNQVIIIYLCTRIRKTPFAGFLFICVKKRRSRVKMTSSGVKLPSSRYVDCITYGNIIILHRKSKNLKIRIGNFDLPLQAK